MKDDLIAVDNKFYKKCSVVMLPTEKASFIHKLLHYNNELRLVGPHYKYQPENEQYQHLYFLSDEPIQNGDWYMVTDFSKPEDIKQATKDITPEEKRRNGYKKITVSTDESLKTIISNHNDFDSEYSLPRPSNDFLLAFCKAQGDIKEVLVEYEECKTHNADACNVRSSCCNNPYKLRIAPDNTITIKRLQQKFTKEELEAKTIVASYGELDLDYKFGLADPEEMFLNMQYYMEYCERNGYVTPQDWIKHHKHF